MLCRAIVSGGDLLVEENRNGCLFSCSLFTKTHKIFPPMPPMNCPYVVEMVVYPERDIQYQILVVSIGNGINS